jgi:hypothetical protein
MASEFSITFAGAGGHDHSGESGNGSLISTTSYSIFDWNTSTIGSQTRITRQIQNKTNLENWIINLLETRPFSPKVLKLQPASVDGKVIVDGTLEAAKIVAKSITGPLLADGSVSGVNIVANTITGSKIASGAIGSDQVNNIMSIIDIQSDFITTNATIYSSDYNGTTPGTGTAGWRLWANGDAEFNDVYVRGTIDAHDGKVGGIEINQNEIQSSGYSGTTAGFKISSDGSAIFNDIEATGTIIATDGSIGGVSLDSGKIYVGNGNFNNVDTSFYLDSSGYLSLKNKLSFDPSGNLVIGTNTTIDNNLYIGNNVRINGAAGDSGKSIVKMRADAESTNSLNHPLHVVNFTNENLLRIRRDGRIDMGKTTSGSTDEDAEVYVNGTLVHGSDSRFKKDISPTLLGLDFINRLNPVQYYLINQTTPYKHEGFIAQDVKKVLDSIGIKSSIWKESDEDESYQYLNYQELIAPIVKAIQELTAKVESLESKGV